MMIGMAWFNMLGSSVEPSIIVPKMSNALRRNRQSSALILLVMCGSTSGRRLFSSSRDTWRKRDSMAYRPWHPAPSGLG